MMAATPPPAMLLLVLGLGLGRSPGTDAASLRASLSVGTRVDLANFHGCRQVVAGEAAWAPKAGLHLIHIPRTMGSTMELCNAVIPQSLPRWGTGEKSMGKDLRFVTPNLLEGAVNRTVALSYADETEVSGTFLGSDPQKIRIAHVPDLARNQVQTLSVVQDALGFAEDAKLKKERMAWTSNFHLQRNCYSQHMPPALLANHPYENPFSPPESNFCVVRHPYDRLISQFGFAEMFEFKSKSGEHFNCTAGSMNHYLTERLREVLLEGDLARDDCHFVPQSLYVYGYDKATGRADTSQTWCNHVLRFETAPAQFNTLMKSQGYGLEMGAKAQASYSSMKMCERLSPLDLSPEVLMLANELFKEDFEMLGYKPSVTDPALSYRKDPEVWAAFEKAKKALSGGQ